MMPCACGGIVLGISPDLMADPALAEARLNGDILKCGTGFILTDQQFPIRAVQPPRLHFSDHAVL